MAIHGNAKGNIKLMSCSDSCVRPAKLSRLRHMLAQAVARRQVNIHGRTLYSTNRAVKNHNTEANAPHTSTLLTRDSMPSANHGPTVMRANPNIKNPHKLITSCLNAKKPMMRSRVRSHFTSDHSKKITDSIHTPPVLHSTHRVEACAAWRGRRDRCTTLALVLCSCTKTWRAVALAGTSKVKRILPSASPKGGKESPERRSVPVAGS